MIDLMFDVIDAVVDPFVVAPTLALKVRVKESSGAKIAAIALRAQIRLDVQRRTYNAEENELLVELFGDPARYGDTLKTMLWTHASQTVLAFEGESEFDVLLPCSYDFEIAANKYFASLNSGSIPLSLLFNGQVFIQGEQGVEPSFVPWNCEANYQLPLATWRKAVDAFFPNAAWVRLDREIFDELRRFKSAAGLRTWDATITRLLEIAKAER